MTLNRRLKAWAKKQKLLRNVDYSLNLEDVAEVYNHSSVIESRLMERLGKAFEVHSADLKDVPGRVAHTGRENGP